MSIDSEIIQLARSGHRCIRVCTTEEAEAAAGAVAAAMALSLPILSWTSVRGVHDGLLADGASVSETENPAAALFHLSRHTEPTLVVLFDAMPFLRQDARTLRALRELIERCDRTGSLVILIDHDADPPAVLRAHSVSVEIPLPTRDRIEDIVRTTIKAIHRELQSKGHKIEADLSRAEFDAILKNLQGLNERQIVQVIRDVTLPDRKLSIEDLNQVLAIKRRILRSEGVLESVESPTSLDQIGGLARLKQWLRQREPALRDDARDLGLVPPRGVLLLGVQGAGKSLCAKAIATAWNRPILRLDAGALYDRYVGESEAKLREALRQAEMMAPVVLWIDEIEKAFASAASTSADGGLSRRMFGCLLTWMQEHTAPVFLAATANDIEALPPELLRKGRFDEIFFVDLPNDAARREIVRIHLRRRSRDPALFDMEQIGGACEGFSGAEIEQAIIGALTECFAERRPLDTAAIIRVMQHSPPLSVTMRERIAELREWAKGRCVPAD